jgi:hypothetical protein
MTWSGNESWSEQVGTFWRSFASSLSAKERRVAKDLLKTHEDLGVEPVGSEAVDNTFWVYSKEVDPFEVAESTSRVL